MRRRPRGALASGAQNWKGAASGRRAAASISSGEIGPCSRSNSATNTASASSRRSSATLRRDRTKAKVGALLDAEQRFAGLNCLAIVHVSRRTAREQVPPPHLPTRRHRHRERAVRSPSLAAPVQRRRPVQPRQAQNRLRAGWRRRANGGCQFHERACRQGDDRVCSEAREHAEHPGLRGDGGVRVGIEQRQSVGGWGDRRGGGR